MSDRGQHGRQGRSAADITVGDCLELLQAIQRIGGGKTSGYFYHLLQIIGVLGAGVPWSVRVFGTTRQGSVDQVSTGTASYATRSEILE